MNFLESTSAVFSIGLNNAVMYEELKYKAQRDPLTNLYNRRFFHENLDKGADQTAHPESIDIIHPLRFLLISVYGQSLHFFLNLCVLYTFNRSFCQTGTTPAEAVPGSQRQIR